MSSGGRVYTNEDMMFVSSRYDLRLLEVKWRINHAWEC